MQDNSQNSWTRLLEDTDSLASETIRDKHEAWERLFSRLHEKPRRKLAAWYWVAASLLIVAVVGTLIVIRNEKHQPVVIAEPSPSSKQMPLAKETKPVNEQKGSGYNLPGQVEKTAPVVLRTKKNAVRTIQLFDKDVTKDSVIGQSPEVAIARNMTVDTVDTTKTVAAVTPPKKKLRVVHLNEIGQPIEEPTVNNGLNEWRRFELRIMSGEIYKPINSSSSNNGLILTKPRNTSN